jgi:hypothetical protein
MGMLVNIEGYGQINFEDADSVEEIQNFIDNDSAFKTQLTEQGFGHLFERPDPGITGDVARGVDQLQAMFYGAGAAVGDVVGSEDLVDWGIEGYERNMAEASKNAATIGTYKNIKDVGDAGRYAVEAIFENLPMFLPSLVTGGVGAYVGRAVAQRAVKTLTADIIAKKMAQGWTQEAAEKLAQHAGGKMILKNFEQQAAKKAALTATGEVAGKNLATKGARIGAYTGALPMTTGEVTGSVYEATGDVRGGLGLMGGAVSAGLEVLPNMMFLSNILGKQVAGGIANSLVKRVGIGTAKGMLAEGPTEFAQTIVEHVAQNIADPSIDIFSPEHNDELIDSFLKGTAAGGGIGATSSFVGGILNRDGGPEETEITIDGTLVDSAMLARDEPNSGRKMKQGALEGIYAGSFTDSNNKTTQVGLFGKVLLPIHGEFEFIDDDEVGPGSGGMETLVDPDGVPLSIDARLAKLKTRTNFVAWLKARGITGLSGLNKHDMGWRVREEMELEEEFGTDVRLDLLNAPDFYIDLKDLYGMRASEVRDTLNRPKARAPESYAAPTVEQQSEIETLKNEILRNAVREENKEGDLVYTLKRNKDVQALIDYYRDNIYTRTHTFMQEKRVKNKETGASEKVEFETTETETDLDAARDQANADLVSMGIQPKPEKVRKSFEDQYGKNADPKLLSEIYNLEQELKKGQYREYYTDEALASIPEKAEARIRATRTRLNELRRKFKLGNVKDWGSNKAYNASRTIRKYRPKDRKWGEVDSSLAQFDEAAPIESTEGLLSPTPQGKFAAAPELFAEYDRNPLSPHERIITEATEPVAVVNAEYRNGNIHVHSLRALRPGGGTIAMGRIVEEALKRGASVSLFAQPFFANPGIQELSPGALKEWYGKFGFSFEDGSDYGIRQPSRPVKHAIGQRTLYSKLEYELENMDAPMDKPLKPMFWLNKLTHMIKTFGQRVEDEMDFVGIYGWLKNTDRKISKAEVLSYLTEHSLLAKMVTESPQYSNYTLGDVGHNYSVLTIQVPGMSASRIKDAQEIYAELPIFKQLVRILDESTNLVDRTTHPDTLLQTIQGLLEKSLIEPGESSNEILVSYLSRYYAEEFPQWDVQQAHDHARNTLVDMRQEMRRAAPAHQSFRKGHFEGKDELIHIRVDERTNANGEKVLVLHEIQSDWHGLWSTANQDLKALKQERKDAIQLERELIASTYRYPEMYINGRNHLQVDPKYYHGLLTDYEYAQARLKATQDSLYRSGRRAAGTSGEERSRQQSVDELKQQIIDYEAVKIMHEAKTFTTRESILDNAILFINDVFGEINETYQFPTEAIKTIEDWVDAKADITFLESTDIEIAALEEASKKRQDLQNAIDKIDNAKETAKEIDLQKPPINDWYALGFKMAILHAADRGINHIMWPTTKEQVRDIEGWAGEQKAEKRIVSMFNIHLPSRAKKFIKKYGGEIKLATLNIYDPTLSDELHTVADFANNAAWERTSQVHQIQGDEYFIQHRAVFGTEDINIPLIHEYPDNTFRLEDPEAPADDVPIYMPTSYSNLEDAQQASFEWGVAYVQMNRRPNKDFADGQTMHQFTVTQQLKDVAEGIGFEQWSRPMAWHGKATQQFQEQAPEVQTKLRALLDQMGLPDISLKVVKAIGDGKYRGRYHERLIEIALNYENPETALKHEAIHALINLGLFTDQELAILNKAAKRWVNELGIREQYADVRNEYGKPLTEEELMEEAIAYKMERFNTEKAEVRSLLKRIADFIKALGETLGVYKFTTPEDIFGRVIRGEVGGRARWNHPKGGEMRQPSEAFMRNANERTYTRAKYAMGSMSGGKETVTTDMSVFAKFTTDNRNQSVWDRDFARMWLPLDYIRRDFNILLDKAIHKLRNLGRIKGNPEVWPQYIKASEIAAKVEGEYKRVPERWQREDWDGDRTIQDGDEIVFINDEVPGIAKNSKLEANEVIILKGTAAQAWVDGQDAHNDILRSFKDSIIYHARDKLEAVIQYTSNNPAYKLTWPEAQELQLQDFHNMLQILQDNVYGYEQDVKRNAEIISQLVEQATYQRENNQNSDETVALLEEAIVVKEELAKRAPEFQRDYDGMKLLSKFKKELGMYEAMIKRDYVPMGRFGSHFIAVYAHEDMVNGEAKANATPKYVEFYEQSPQEKALKSLFIKNGNARRAEIQAKFPEDHVSNMGSVSKDELHKNLRGLGEQIDLLWSTLNSEDRATSKQIFKDFTDKLDDGHGTFFSNMQTRKKIPGFEIEDIHRSTGQYIIAGAHISTRLKHKRDSDAGLNVFIANNGGKKGARRRAHAIETHDFILGSEEGYQKMKQLGFVWYLGGNISTGFLQMMSMPQFAMFNISKFSGMKSVGKVAATMAKATSDVMKGFVWGPQKVYDDIPFDPNKMAVNDNELRFILRAMAESITKQGSFLEESGISVNELAMGTKAKATQAWRSFMVKYMAAPFSTFETLSRTASALAAFRMAQDPKVRARADFVMKDDNLWQQELEDRGLEEADAFHIAKYVVNESFGQFGKENKPPMYRGGSGAIFQFTYYPMAMFQGLGRMFMMQGAEGRKAFAGVMLMLMITAGMRGLPGADDSEKILRFMLRNVSGLDVDMGLILRQAMQDVQGGAHIADFIENGIFNAMGINVQSRVSMGQIPGIDIPLSLFGIQGNNADVLGLAGSYITSGQRAVRLLSEERRAEAMAATFPAFLRNGIKAAFVYPTEGVRTISGTQLLKPEDIKWYHKAAQVIGFTPTVVSNARTREFTVSRLNEASQNKKRNYERRLEKYRYQNIKATMDKRTGDMFEAQQKFAELVKEIVEYNLHAAPEDKIIPSLDNINKRVLGRLYPDLARIGQVDKRHRAIAHELYKEGSAYVR